MKKCLVDNQGYYNELFAKLQVWNDLNQDAKVQEGKLQTLSEAGIQNIDLNYVSTNINGYGYMDNSFKSLDIEIQRKAA